MEACSAAMTAATWAKREIVVEVGGQGVVDAVVEAQAERAAASGIGLGGCQGMEEFSQGLAARVLEGGGGGAFAGGDAVLDVDDRDDGSRGAGQREGGVVGGGGFGFGLGVAVDDLLGGVTGGDHVEIGQLAGEAQLAEAAVGVGFRGADRRCDQMRPEAALVEGDGSWHK